MTARWSEYTSEEEQRSYKQDRLTRLAEVMFWSFLVLFGFIVVAYTVYPHVEPVLNGYIYVTAAVGMASLVILWRVALERRRLSLRTLHAIDIFFSVGTGLFFAASGVLAYDLRPSAYICVIYGCFIVLLRAAILPSEPRTTILIGVATCLPMTAGTVALVYLNDQDVPGPMYVGGGVLICAMAIALAAYGSDILYASRREVSELRQLGQYTLVSELGRGAMGVVYRARHALLRRDTAVKVMLHRAGDRDSLDRFEREVQHMSELTHPNTVVVYDYGRSPDGDFYYVMEYLAGINLEQLVETYGPQPPVRVVSILRQVCGALQEAHERQLIHRDIKPANIILCERGGVPDVAKVVDFGIVKELERSVGTSTPGVFGTPHYLAPESITDPDGVGPAADLYGLGAVGFYLLTGRRVFEGATNSEVFRQHVEATPPLPSAVAPVDVPRELEQVILHCLAKDPRARPASARALAERLDEVRSRLEARAATARAGDGEAPGADGWDDAVARRWWQAFRSAPARAAEAHAETQTMRIDIDGRTQPR